VILNGGGKVTLSGAGQRRILYLNACDKLQVWITNHCYDQATPRLTVENIAFTDGNATGKDITGGSGGAIYAQGGQLKVVNSQFTGNRCYPEGPDLGGGAIRALMQYQNRPVYVGEQHLHRRRVLQRRRAQQHPGVLDRARQRAVPQQRDRLGRQPGAEGTEGGGSGAPSTTTATPTP